MPKNVFISLPMSGLDNETIRENIMQARKEYRNRFDNPNVIFFDHFGFGDAHDSLLIKHPNVWYLGGALRFLSACDEAFFYGNWQEARGCQIEHKVCELYGIPIVEV